MSYDKIEGWAALIGIIFVVLLWFAVCHCHCHADELYFAPAGITHHGPLSGYKNSARPYKRSLMNAGEIVWNPEASITYRRGELLANLTAYDDCFGRTGYFAGIGQALGVAGGIELGVMLGLFVRRSIEPKGDLERRRWKPGWEAVSLPFLSAQYDWPLFRDYNIALIGISNVALTHINLSIGRDL